MPDWYSHSIWTSKSSTSVNGIAPTWTVTVDELVRPQLVPTILTLYVPAFAVDGTLIVAVVLLAVHPNRLVSAKVADQPAGTSLKLSRTRSKKLELRLTVTGTAIDGPRQWGGVRRSRRDDAERSEGRHAVHVKQRLVDAVRDPSRSSN